jgi:rhodanese-related sulfurtransferase
MVIQCSLLTSVHERAALAAAIASVFEGKIEGAPLGDISVAVLSHDGLIGVLRACEDQTAAFNWNDFLTAAATRMEISIERAFEALPSGILRGVITMLPFAQILPKDRLIIIICDSGVCLLAVWAHYLLGLTVLIRTYIRSIYKEVRFGSGREQVLIDDRRGILVDKVAIVLNLRLLEFNLADI